MAQRDPLDLARPASTRLSRRGFLKTSLAAGAVLAVPASRRPERAAAAFPPVPGAGSRSPADVWAELEAFVAERMAHHRVPGVALGLILDGESFSTGFGITNVDHPLPVDTETLFQIGSTTKPYTATAIARLVERGDLDLAAPVRTYLPEFRVADETVSASVRLLDLLTHTAGWYGDDFTDTGDGDDALARYVAGMADLPQIAPLGRYFSYNNAAVSTAGRVIEVVTGQPYEVALRELVLEPLGLERSFLFAEEVMTEAFAVGHDASLGAPTVLTPWALPRSVNPAGGVLSSIDDLLGFARFHLGDGTRDGRRVLDPETLNLMQTLHGPGGSLGLDVIDGVGMSWLLRTVDGVQTVSHGGSTFGQETNLILVPERGLALALLTNATSGAILGHEAIEWVLRQALGLHSPTIEAVPIPASDLRAYEGDFVGIDGSAVRFRVEGDTLVAEPLVDGERVPGPAIPIVYAGGNLFFLEDLPGARLLVDFERDDAGRVGWFRFGGRLLPRTD